MNLTNPNLIKSKKKDLYIELSTYYFPQWFENQGEDVWNKILSFPKIFNEFFNYSIVKSVKPKLKENLTFHQYEKLFELLKSTNYGVLQYYLYNVMSKTIEINIHYHEFDTDNYVSFSILRYLLMNAGK